MCADEAYKSLGISRDNFVEELTRVVADINLFGYALTNADLIADDVAVDVCEYTNVLDNLGYGDASLNLSAARVILKAVGGDVPKLETQRSED